MFFYFLPYFKWREIQNVMRCPYSPHPSIRYFLSDLPVWKYMHIEKNIRKTKPNYFLLHTFEFTNTHYVYMYREWSEKTLMCLEGKHMCLGSKTHVSGKQDACAWESRHMCLGSKTHVPGKQDTLCTLCLPLKMHNHIFVSFKCTWKVLNTKHWHIQIMTGLS